MDISNSVPRRRFSWLILLAGTVGVYLLASVIFAFMAEQQMAFDGSQVLLPVAVSCLPAAWSVFILWKFRGFAERVVGIISAIPSLFLLYDAVRVIWMWLRTLVAA